MIPRGYVPRVRYPRLVNQLSVHGHGQISKQAGDYVSLCFLTPVKMQGLHRLLGGLVGRETSPFMPALTTRRLRLLEISLGLGQPIPRSIRQCFLFLQRGKPPPPFRVPNHTTVMTRHPNVARSGADCPRAGRSGCRHASP